MLTARFRFTSVNAEAEAGKIRPPSAQQKATLARQAEYRMAAIGNIVNSKNGSTILDADQEFAVIITTTATADRLAPANMTISTRHASVFNRGKRSESDKFGSINH